MHAVRIERAIVVLIVALTCLALTLSSPASAVAPSPVRADAAWGQSLYLPGRDSFRSWIGSSIGLCLPGRSAQLVKATLGPDAIVGTGITNRFGMVEFAGYPRPAGRYYVEFSPIFRYDGAGTLTHCRAIRSESLYVF